MDETQPLRVSMGDARLFFDGPEVCREYLHDEQMWFGTSTLQPGMTGGVDAGHPESVEAWFVCSGHVAIDTGATVFELHEGDLLRIPQGVPHTLTNLGSTVATAVWVGVPGD